MTLPRCSCTVHAVCRILHCKARPCSSNRTLTVVKRILLDSICTLFWCQSSRRSKNMKERTTETTTKSRHRHHRHRRHNAILNNKQLLNNWGKYVAPNCFVSISLSSLNRTRPARQRLEPSLAARLERALPKTSDSSMLTC